MKVNKRVLVFSAAAAAAVLGVAVLVINMYFSGSGVMIYMYHSVREIPVNPDYAELSVLPSEFEKHLAFFSGSGIKTLFADELAGMEGKQPLSVVLTFDDGYEDNYTEVFPLLKKYNCKATIFMIADRIGKEGYLSAEQIREMTQSGLVSVQSHTVSHEPLALGDKEYEEVVYELEESKKMVEAASGGEVICVAMPNGSYDGVVLDIARRYYDVIFTGDSLHPYSLQDAQDANRAGIYRRHSISDVRRMTKRRGNYVVLRAVQKLAQF